MSTPAADTHPTLADVVNTTAPDGGLLPLVELLNQQNEMLMDMVTLPSNGIDDHTVAVRAGLPTGVWRGYNVGVPPSKGKTAIVVERIGNYENRAVVDKDLAERNGNSAAWRLQQERGFIEEMNQTMQQNTIYGLRASEPNGFTGLAPRYNTRTASKAESADNVVHGGGSGSDNGSIWLVCWGPSKVYGLYPKNSRAGLQVTDLGEMELQNVETAAGDTNGFMTAYSTKYKWQLGLCVEDWRYVVRIANIDKSALKVDRSGNSADLSDLMFQAMELLPDMAGKSAFYMARDMRTMLYRQNADKVKGSTLTVEQVGGVRTMMFQGMVPIRRVDRLAADEAVVGT